MKRILATVALSVALVACGSGGDDSSSSGSGSTGTSSSGSTSGSGSSGSTGNGSSGSTGAPQPQAPTITTFTASPAALPPGGGDVTLSWAVEGAQTLDLEPGSINVTGLQSWTVSGITANASFRLIATNAAGTSVASANVTVASPGALTGTVVDALGLPLAYQHVVVPGHAPTLTALDGTFSLDDVVAPYTLVVSTYDGTFTEIFDQISDPAPVVTLSPDGPNVSSGYVDVGGPLLSQNPDAGTSVYLASAFDQERSDLGASASSYDIGLYTPLFDGGAPGLALAVQNITFDDGGWVWDQVGTATFTIPADGSPVDAGITLGAANPFDVSVNVTGLNPNFGGSLDFGFQSSTSQPVYLTNMDLDPAVSSYQTSLPNPGLTPLVHAGTYFEGENTDCAADSYRFVSPGSAVSLDLAQPPVISSPFPDSSGLPQSGATFSWASVGGTDTAYGLALYIDYNGSPEPDHTFVVFTHATHFTMPDLSALGLHLDNNSSYYLEVAYISDITSELELAKFMNSGPTPQDARKDGWCELNFFVGEPPPFF